MFVGVGRAHALKVTTCITKCPEAGVINQKDLKQSKIALVYGQMNEPPGARLESCFIRPPRSPSIFAMRRTRTCCSSSTISFAFLKLDRKSRHCSAGRPAPWVYQPTLAAEMGALQERITSTKKGSITSFQAVYVPADDLTDPAPATTFAHLDATIVLERAIAELGIYPAVDPLGSTSRALELRDCGAGALRCGSPRAERTAALQRLAGHHRDSGDG